MFARNDFCTMEMRLDTVEAIAEHGAVFTRLSGMGRATGMRTNTLCRLPWLESTQRLEFNVEA